MPSLTVAVQAGNKPEKIARLLECLRRQTIAAEIEVIVISLAESESDIRQMAGGLDLLVLHHPGSADFGHARAEAARRARAPFIAYLEDHTAPEPDWAEQVRDAFLRAGPEVTVISYAFKNGSPDTYLYRSAFMAEYGALAVPLPEGPARSVTANNIAYRRDALLAAGAELDSLLEIDYFLQKAMKEKFHCRTAPRAVVAHQTNARPGELVRVHFLYALLFASRRVQHEGWGLPKRIAVAAIAPVIVPLLRLGRLFRSLRDRAPLPSQAWMALPVILLLYGAGGLGEAVGLLKGAGVSSRLLVWMELEADRARR